MSKKDNPVAELLTLKEASQLLKCHPNTLRAWDKSGLLPAIKIGKRQDFRYHKQDILDFINPRTSSAKISTTTSSTTSPKLSGTDLLMAAYREAPHAILVSTLKEGEFINVNKSFLNMFGYSREEVIGKTSQELNIWANYSQRQQLVQAIMETGHLPPTGYQYRRKDGEIKYGVVSASLVTVADKDYLVAETYDDSERQNAYQKLETTHYELDAILKTVPEGVVVYDTQGNILYVNQQAAHITGFKDVNDFIKAGTKTKINQNFFYRVEIRDENQQVVPLNQLPTLQVFQGKPYAQLTVQFVYPKTKQTKWILLKSQSFFNEKKEIKNVVTVMDDITQQKLLEQQKDIFVGVATHELKTPVTSLKAYTQVLHRQLRMGKTTTSDGLLNKMVSQVNRINDLISNLLDASILENGQIKYNLEDFDFNRLVRETVEDLQLVHDTHQLQTQLTGRKRVSADRERTQQVITNLINNAVKYSPNQNKVLIKTTSTSKDVKFSVTDYGLGIPAEQQTKIFDRFYRANHQSPTPLSGFGLGLYISKKIITQQGGRLTVTSQPGKGSTFTFTLPAR